MLLVIFVSDMKGERVTNDKQNWFSIVSMIQLKI